MAKSLTLEYVKQCFIDVGCICLADEYKNNSIKLPYICECGNKSEIRFHHFRDGKRCMKCSGRPKLSLSFVKQYFIDHNCICLADEYIDNHTKMLYICECGNKSEINFGNFKDGSRCGKCSGNERLTLEYVKQCFIDGGCICLADRYSNNREKLPYICECGNKSEIIFHAFIRGQRCFKCNGSEKYTLEYLIDYFKSQNCICLADEYYGNNVKLPYICECGNKSEIIFSNFLRGGRCGLCSASKGEKFIENYLKLNGIDYISQYKIFECRNKKSLPFDFYINNYLFNEFNGEQHYIPCSFGGREENAAFENFRKVVISDYIKESYCKANNRPLFIIPFWERNRIDELLNTKINGKKVVISDPPKKVLEYLSLKKQIIENYINGN